MDYIFGASGEDVVKGRKLQVRVGSSLETLAVTKVNDDSNPHYIDSPYFTGQIVVRVKNFEGVYPEGPQNSTPASEAYFDGKKRLFALQISGRFKHNYTADDIVFGSQFEKKCNPPYGSSVAMKFANLIDPALQTDIFCDSPWIFSPILCSMNVVNVVKTSKPITGAAPTIVKPKKTPKKEKHDADKSSTSINTLKSENDILSNNPVMIKVPDPAFVADATHFVSAPVSLLKPEQSATSMLEPWKWVGGTNELEEDTTVFQDGKIEYAVDSWAERRRHFQKAKVRQDTLFSPDHIYNFEIYAPFINLSTFDLSLGINVNILQYLNNQPLRMMAKSLSLGKYLFIVEFNLVEDESSPKSVSSTSTKSFGHNSQKSI